MVRKHTGYDSKTRAKAEKYRSEGLSYKRIYDLLKIPKSTLSTWFGDKFPGVFDKEMQREHLTRIRKLALRAKRIKKEQEEKTIRDNINTEITNYPLKNKGFLKSLLSVLYWAEGAKYLNSPVIFVNTDPRLAKLFITLIRKCYTIDESKFRVRLHLHYYHSIKNSRWMWSKLLNVPVSRFGKIHIKKRSQTKKFKKNFAGICFIKYYDTRVRKEIMELIL
ncbi:MAG: hypothetical protein AAB566_00220, partial [Patescibacteria group bacterium]